MLFFHLIAVLIGVYGRPAQATLPSGPIDTPRCDAQITLPLKANPYLTDPFQLLGANQNVTSEALWQCRREEIKLDLQQYELGWLPDPPTSLDASFDNQSNNLTITAHVNDSSITWIVPVIYQNISTSAPWPAMIAYGASSFPIPANVVIMNFDNSAFAVQNNASNRGQGLFYDLFGQDASAGALMAWTWGVGRILDALEKVNNTGIDPARVGITGCSRNGKGATVAAAFEERLALTIPQESGSGGTACWRLSDDEYARGNSDQTLMEIVYENVWYSKTLEDFVGNTTYLPFDHHLLMGLVAPRGFLAIDNSAIEWLTPESQYGCEVAAGLIYQALGVDDHFGHSMVGNHSHCHFPAAQQPHVNAFVDKFLFGKNATNTTVNDHDYGVFNYSQWINWEPSINRPGHG